MKKNFYAFACIAILLSLTLVSCQKDNLQTSSQSVKQGTGTSSTSDGGAWSSTPEPPAAHPTCPASGGHH